MSRLTKEDIAQIDRNYIESLEQKVLVEVAYNLREYVVELIEQLEQTSKNSSKPPSSDSPYKKGSKKDDKDNHSGNPNANDADDDADKRSDGNTSQPESDLEDKDISAANDLGSDQHGEAKPEKRAPGKQPGAQGFWRESALIPDEVIPHYPEFCSACNAPIQFEEGQKPHMGHHVLEIEKTDSGIRVFCTLHHYYTGVCGCGHETKSYPGKGSISKVEGRKKVTSQ